jgi:hypothetical protein
MAEVSFTLGCSSISVELYDGALTSLTSTLHSASVSSATAKAFDVLGTASAEVTFGERADSVAEDVMVDDSLCTTSDEVVVDEVTVDVADGLAFDIEGKEGVGETLP